MATEYKQFKFRRGTAVEWQSNPVLAEGEPGIDLTARRMKVGDGVTAWSGLPWSSMAASEVARLEAAATALAGATAPTDAAMTTIQANPNSAFAQAQKATFVSVLAAAKNPDLLITGTITRDANQAVTSAQVVWPDGTPGTFTALVLSSTFPGAVDSYKITYGSPVSKTFTQPAITRNAAGAATTVPQIVVS